MNTSDTLQKKKIKIERTFEHTFRSFEELAKHLTKNKNITQNKCLPVSS